MSRKMGWYTKKSGGKVAHLVKHDFRGLMDESESYYTFCDIHVGDTIGESREKWKFLGKEAKLPKCQKCLNALKREKREDELAAKRGKKFAEKEKKKWEKKRAKKTGTCKLERRAIMSVYEDGRHRIQGLPEPRNAGIEGGFSLIGEMLKEMQEKAVWPGTKLKITIEEA